VSQRVKLRKAKLMTKIDEIARENVKVTRMLLRVDESGEVWIEDADLVIETKEAEERE
jgi:hypothetical protein